MKLNPIPTSIALALAIAAFASGCSREAAAPEVQTTPPQS